MQQILKKSQGIISITINKGDELMKVIKKDGRAVLYERGKIETSILNANNDVLENERASGAEIEDIICYIEDLGKKRILVEDIQDIVEEKLMEIGKCNLAKEYIAFGDSENKANKVVLFNQMRA